MTLDIKESSLKEKIGKQVRNTSIVSEYTKGKIVNLLIPGHSLLLSKMGEWYEQNTYHKYNEGDILILKGNAFGYGVRPVGFVEGYEMIEERGKMVGRYNIFMHKDSEGSFDSWINGESIPDDRERSKGTLERHFKWNIENQFKRVDVKNVYEALDRY